MNKFIELSVETNPLWSECLSEILMNKIGCFGVIVEEVEYKGKEIIKDNRNIVKGFLWFKEPHRPDIGQIQQTLTDIKKFISIYGISPESLGSWKVSTRDIEDEDWAHNWKKFWHVQKIGNSFVICPSWETYTPKESEVTISLDPGTAFGTGTHSSTRLCMIGLEKYMQLGFKVADIGTGSGILAIAAAKLGAKRVVGVDNDPSVIDVAVENANKNNVLDLCEFFAGSAKNVTGQYDIVLVNIVAEVIVIILEDVIKLAKSGTKFIFSGIIDFKQDQVIENAQNLGLKILEVYKERDDEQWMGIIAEK